MSTICLLQSICNHIYSNGDSSKTADEREEKWRRILNHIVNVRKQHNNKTFVECLRGTIEREWLKQG